MLGSWSKEAGAQLYCIETSGTGYGYWGCAAGKAKSAAKTELEKIKMADMQSSSRKLPRSSTRFERIRHVVKIIVKIWFQVHFFIQNVENMTCRSTTR